MVTTMIQLGNRTQNEQNGLGRNGEWSFRFSKVNGLRSQTSCSYLCVSNYGTIHSWGVSDTFRTPFKLTIMWSK